MKNMNFYVDKTEALQKREILFLLLKNEGLTKGENPQISEKDIDAMWDWWDDTHERYVWLGW